MIFSRVGLYMQAKKAGLEEKRILIPFASEYYKEKLYGTAGGNGGACVTLKVLAFTAALAAFMCGFVEFRQLGLTLAIVLGALALCFKLVGDSITAKGQCECYGMDKKFQWALFFLPDFANLYLGISRRPYTPTWEIKSARVLDPQKVIPSSERIKAADEVDYTKMDINVLLEQFEQEKEKETVKVK